MIDGQHGGRFAAGWLWPTCQDKDSKVRVAFIQQAKLLCYSKGKHCQAFTTAPL